MLMCDICHSSAELQVHRLLFFSADVSEGSNIFFVLLVIPCLIIVCSISSCYVKCIIGSLIFTAFFIYSKCLAPKNGVTNSM